MKFVSGDLVRNVTTNEDGRVIEAYEESGMVIYMASVPINGTSWMRGQACILAGERIGVFQERVLG